MLGRGESLLGRLAAGCEGGPITVRASRGGVTYQATLCGSQNVPERAPDEYYEPVTVVRGDANK